MTVRTFGRKGSEDAAMASRREAFLASERARREQPSPAEPNNDPAPVAATSRPIFVREKSLAVAYMAWFFFGAISAHRFYLGYPSSAVAQACLWIISWMMIAAGFLFAGFGLLAGCLWMIADAFLIPGLCRGANERARQNATEFAFA